MPQLLLLLKTAHLGVVVRTFLHMLAHTAVRVGALVVATGVGIALDLLLAIPD
jgi:hypothetical protein